MFPLSAADYRSPVDSSADLDQLWRLALEHSPVGMTLVDLEGRMLVVNHAL